MKVCAFQPKYPYAHEDTKAYLDFILATLDLCDESLDLIVLPECCNAPSSYPSAEIFRKNVEVNTPILIEKTVATAKRCKAIVSVNLYEGKAGKYRNTTLLWGPDGKITGRYLKQHLPATELDNIYVDSSYTLEYNPPTIIEINGIRYGFLTCYDCYFEEYVAHLAARKPDIVIVSSHQRGERSDILEMQTKSIAFNCNAYVVRSSISMGDTYYPYGANTMIVAPSGIVLSNIGQTVGVLTQSIDPRVKYVRSFGYGNYDIRNDIFISNGRTPWSYRACGSSAKPGDRQTGYPRVCAHRGFNTVLPENTMPAFALAISLGADELELDVWPTKDHRFVVCHDPNVDRTSDGHGALIDLTWEQVKEFAIRTDGIPEMEKLHFCLLDEVLKQYAQQVIINLHIKSVGSVDIYDREDFKRLVDLIYHYDCSEHVYIAGVENVLRTALKVAPELSRCALDETLDHTLVSLAKRYECEKLQLYRDEKQDYFDQQMIDEANASGIRCNIFWSDDPQDAIDLLERGVKTILTNDFLRIANVVFPYRNKLREDGQDKNTTGGKKNMWK